MEEWKKIDEYENYSVSRDGEVRNDKTGNILKKFKDKNAYELVDLYKNGKRKKFKVHRLVAEAFIENIENKPCVDHINTIRDDNRVENLRWCTYEENNNNPLTIEKMSGAKKGENAYWYGKQRTEETKKKISEANKGKYNGENHPQCRKIILLNTREIFDCIKQASEKYGVSQSHICNCCKGKKKSAGKLNGEKMIWMYYEDYLESLK